MVVIFWAIQTAFSFKVGKSAKKTLINTKKVIENEKCYAEFKSDEKTGNCKKAITPQILWSWVTIDKLQISFAF